MQQILCGSDTQKLVKRLSLQTRNFTYGLEHIVKGHFNADGQIGFLIILKLFHFNICSQVIHHWKKIIPLTYSFLFLFGKPYTSVEIFQKLIGTKIIFSWWLTFEITYKSVHICAVCSFISDILCCISSPWLSRNLTNFHADIGWNKSLGYKKLQIEVLHFLSVI